MGIIPAKTSNRVNATAVKASVIIPCYNAQNTIRMTLESICGQECDFDYEVIVIDSSSDGTDIIIRNEFPQVTLIRLDKQTLPGSGRNLGVMKAQGDIIAFTDSDAVPDKDWLAKIVHLHKTVDTDGVGGCVINGYPKSLTAWVIHLTEFTEWLEQSPAGFVTNVPSVNISFKRETFHKYGICYSDYFPSEDTLFNWSLIERGGKLYFDPSVRLVHMSRVGFRKLWQHQRKLGKASAYARRISTLPGQIFVRFPVLALSLPLLRWVRASLRFMQTDFRLVPAFLAITPFYLFALTAWTSGFLCRTSFDPPRYQIEGCTFDQFG